MKYEDALAECLARIDAGEEFEAVLVRFPKEAPELREDVAVARGLHTISATLPARPGGEEHARMRMQTALRAEGQARRGRSFGANAPWPFAALGRFALPGFAVAAVAVVALVLTLAGASVGQPLRSLTGTSSAEAATLEGVVVDNANGVLTVQTSNGLETVNVDAKTPIADSSGTKTSLADVIAGEVVTIKGKRLGNGSVAASQIDRKTLAALKDWCDMKADQCQQLKDRLETLVGQCQAQSRASCVALASRLQDLREKLDIAGGQLRDLQQRCQAGGQAACRELRRFCGVHKNLCPAQDQSPPKRPAAPNS